MFIGVWGLPGAAHDNDAHRTVAAALEMIRALGALETVATIGVTTGKAFCGNVGTPERREVGEHLRRCGGIVGP